MKRFLLLLVIYLLTLTTSVFILYLTGKYDDYEIYTPNDIIYVDRHLFGSEITSETSTMHLRVFYDHRNNLILEKLSIPCDRYEYEVLIDSLQNIY